MAEAKGPNHCRRQNLFGTYRHHDHDAQSSLDPLAIGPNDHSIAAAPLVFLGHRSINHYLAGPQATWLPFKAFCSGFCSTTSSLTRLPIAT